MEKITNLDAIFAPDDKERGITINSKHLHVFDDIEKHGIIMIDDKQNHEEIMRILGAEKSLGQKVILIDSLYNPRKDLFRLLEKDSNEEIFRNWLKPLFRLMGYEEDHKDTIQDEFIKLNINSYGDLKREYDLIETKQSKLSSSMRKKIQTIYGELYLNTIS